MVSSLPPDPPLRTVRRARLLLLVLGALVAAATLWTAAGRDCVSNSDEAAYAEQAASFLEGRPLQIGFVRHFHVRYPPEILHPEDFYPPGNGMLLALSWWLLGRSDFASTVPSVLLGCLVLPWLAFALARRLGATAPYAAACGAAVLLASPVREHVLQGLADLPLTVCVTAAALLALRPGGAGAALAGAFLGLGFWLKPAALLFTPGVGLMAWLARPRLGWRGRLTHGGVMAAVFLAVSAPWLVRNATTFGDPLYSGNKHLTAAANSPDFHYEDIRKVYWTRTDEDAKPPGLAEGLTRFGLRAVASRFLLHLWQLVVEHGPAAFGFFFLVAAVMLRHRRRARAVVFAVAAYGVCLAAVFAVELRYLLPTTALVAAVCWVFGERVARRLWPHARSAPLLLALAAALPGAATVARDVVAGHGPFAAPGDLELRDAALWARDHLPADAVVMSQEALRFRHYSGHRTVNVPFDDPAAVEAVVRAYHVHYIVQNRDGDFARLANSALERYFDAYPGLWRRRRPQGLPFAVWVRKGTAAPR